MSAEDEFSITATGMRWLRNVRLSMAERREARRVCRELLAVHRQVTAERPELAGEALYREIVIRHQHADEGQAKELLNRAEQSFAQWPTPRDLTFQDVVLYVVLKESLEDVEARPGPQADLAEIVCAAIPMEL